jgi:hypothetical protein
MRDTTVSEWILLTTTLQLTRGLGTRLLVWSLGSFVIGIFLFFSTTPLLQGIGLQAMLWGVIDGFIGAFAFLGKKEQPAENIARILGINVGLDVIYQLIGLSVLLFLWQDAYMMGNGIGVIIQGAFLFVLDLFYYTRFKQLTEEVVSDATLDALPDEVFVALGRRGMDPIPLKECTYECDGKDLELISMKKGKRISGKGIEQMTEDYLVRCMTCNRQFTIRCVIRYADGERMDTKVNIIDDTGKDLGWLGSY